MPEADDQKAIVTHFRETYPEHMQALRVSQMGNFRGRGRAGAIRMAKAKGQGAVTGESDFAILLPRGRFHYAVIEYKTTEDKRAADPAQIDYCEYHRGNGACAMIVKGLDAMTAAIDTYMNLGAFHSEPD